MAVNVLIPFLVAMMLVTGVCNTLLTKYQDNQCVRDCDSPDPDKRLYFEQPVIQTIQMFIGEMGCWLVVGAFSLYRYYMGYRIPSQVNGYQALGTTEPQCNSAETESDSIQTNEPMASGVKASVKTEDRRLPLKGSRVFLLSLPAICDILGTTLMNLGLVFVVASIYQMTRGALVIFVGIFSVIFLKKRLQLFQWSALVTVVLGVGIVGLAGALYHDEKATPATVALLVRAKFGSLIRSVSSPNAERTVLGILLIAGAQVSTAIQFVLEEFILENYALEPIKVVGWEGVFGFLITLFGMSVVNLAIGSAENGYFDMSEGWRQITTYKSIGISSILIMISIGGFNFFGLSVTRSVSATSRSTIDTCRTLFIWIVSIFLGWETFKWLQVVGFALLIYGTFLFNGIVRPPLKKCMTGDVEELLPEEPIEHL